MPDVSGHAFDLPGKVVSTIAQIRFRACQLFRQPGHSGDEFPDFQFVLWSHRGAVLIWGRTREPKNSIVHCVTMLLPGLVPGYLVADVLLPQPGHRRDERALQWLG